MLVARPLLMLIACVAAGCSSSGVSSSTEGEDEQVAALLLTTSGVGLLATTGGAITTVEASEQAPSVWLENRRAIDIAIARGGGTWVDDLAAEIQLPRGLVPHLGATLKRHRRPLARALETRVRREMWEILLGHALCCDPWVRPFAHRRFTCPTPGEGVVTCVPP